MKTFINQFSNLPTSQVKPISVRLLSLEICCFGNLHWKVRKTRILFAHNIPKIYHYAINNITGFRLKNTIIKYFMDQFIGSKVKSSFVNYYTCFQILILV